eukprot:15327523-Ditylum_brightwellii.AAC.1
MADYEDNVIPYLKAEETIPQNIATLERENSEMELRQISEKKGIKIPGVQKALNLQENSFYTHLEMKAICFVCAVQACPLP